VTHVAAWRHSHGSSEPPRRMPVGLLCRRLSLGSPPSGRLRLFLGAEPVLASGRIDPGLVVVSLAGNVIDALPRSRDVALDDAFRKRTDPLHSDFLRQTLAPAPLPRRHECAPPDASASEPRDIFFADIVERKTPVSQRPTLVDHPRVEVFTANPAEGHGPTTSRIEVTRLTRHQTVGDLCGQGVLRLAAARIELAIRFAFLPGFESVDTIQTHVVTCDQEVIAVFRGCWSCEVPGDRIEACRE